MALNLAKLMKIENEERHVVFALLIQSVFIGAFAGALDIGANAMFLEKYTAERIPEAFMISGIVGIIFTSVYAYFQSRIKFKIFAVLNLLLVLILATALRFSFDFYKNQWLEFAVFVMMGPMIIITFLGFWGTSARLFTHRQGKRLFGIIDTGQIVGIILAFYAVPILVNFNFILPEKLYDTLYIGIGSLLIATILQFYLAGKFKFVVQLKEKTRKRPGFFTLFSNRYTSLMAFLVAMGVITAFFIHYSFLTVTELQYSSKDLVGFLGTFLGTMMIFTLLLKRFFYGWLMKKFGLRVALLIAPGLIALLAGAALVLGNYFGYNREDELFPLFFLLISLSKLFHRSLKESIEVPSMKILYQSLAPGIRNNVQERIDGTFNEFTAFFAGLVMAGLVSLGITNPEDFTLIMLLFLAIWFIVGIRLYKRYKQSLKLTLSKAEELRPIADKSYLPAPEYSEGTFLLAEMLKTNPYFKFFLTNAGYNWLLAHKDPAIKEIISEFPSRSIKFVSDASLKRVHRDKMQADIRGYINYISKIELPDGANLEDSINSPDKEIVLAALQSVSKKGDKSQIPNIISLFRDPDINIRIAAIETIETIKGKAAGSYLTDYLTHPLLYKASWSALVGIGEEVLENLEYSFHRRGAGDKVQLRVIRAMTAIGGERANQYLFGKIDYHQREVAFESVKGLFINNYKVSESQKPFLFQVIRDVVETGSWNLVAKYTISRENRHDGLLSAINDEINRANELLFMLLAITYNKNSIKHIWNSLNNQETHDISYAVELLNLHIDEQLRDFLEPYFEDISVAEKIRRLQTQFSVEIVSYVSLLHEIISRDGKLLGDYIRVCAIDEFRNFDQEPGDYLLAAQAFHPHPVIRQSAGAVIKMNDKERFDSLNRRVELDLLDYEDEKRKSEKFPIHPKLGIMDDLRKWKLFENTDLNELLKLSILLKRYSSERVKDKNYVTLVRSDLDREGAVLTSGMAIIAYYHQEHMDLINSIAAHPGSSVYQVDLSEFNELLFDNIGLLACLNDLYKQSESLHMEVTKEDT